MSLIVPTIIWITDRFIAGYFCFPWECVHRDIRIESLLLDPDDHSDDWIVSHTSFLEVERAEENSVTRNFYRELDIPARDFYQEIYQYRSVRGATYQFHRLKQDLPRSYSLQENSAPIRNDPVSYASSYIAVCALGNHSMCYYIGQYQEYIVVLLVPFAEQTGVPEQFFSELVSRIDEKVAVTLGIIRTC